MSVINITSENFEEEVLKSDKPVLLDFWATWCGPCRMLHPVIHSLATEVEEAKICQVNIDEQPKLAEQFRVMTIPTLAVLKEGKIVNSSVGVKSKDAILQMMEL